MFPIINYDKSQALPESGNYYVIASNGIFLHKDTGIVSALVPVKEISFLDEIETDCWAKCNLPKLTFDDVYLIKTFFQKVVEAYRAEACVILSFNKEMQTYRISAPKQSVSHGGVKYERLISKDDGYIQVGTIHSHCDFDAFHSHTDVKDEEDFDGIHITFGHNDKQEFSITSSIVVNGFRSTVDPLSYLDGVKEFQRNGETFYAFVSPYVVKPEATNTINGWFENVHPMIVKRPLLSKILETQQELKVGEEVTWSKIPDNQWIKTYGKGPFNIISIEEFPSIGKMAKIQPDVQDAIRVPVAFLDKVN